MRYAELFCRSNFSFLEGASHPEELIAQAKALGLHALALTDRDGVYGLVRAWRAAQTHGLRLLSGALITVEGQPSLVLLVKNREGWGGLCRLLTCARAERPKGTSLATLEQVELHAAGLVAVLHGPWRAPVVQRLREAFGADLFLSVSRTLQPADVRVLGEVQALSQVTQVPWVLVGDVQAHVADRKRVLDVLTCIRLGLRLDQAGRDLAPNAARVLRSAEAHARYFPGHVEAMARTVEIAERCTFTLADLDYRYPREVVPEGHTAKSWLSWLCEEGVAWRYPAGVPPAVARQIDYVLEIIERLDFPAYFLTVYDIVRFAREQGILCQGRGSAANSAVCFVLGITSVDPARSHLLFERFMSEERGEPPDIDVDFEHERREEVLQYIYSRYGRDRAAMVNEVICYRGRSAVREVGKVMGLSADQLDALSKVMTYRARTERDAEVEDSGTPHAARDARLREVGLDPRDERVGWTVALTEEIRDFPRHTSIHSGGFVLTDDPLVGRVPIEPATMKGRTVIQWDKDDIAAVQFIKVDCLGLGILTAIRKCFDLIAGCQTLRERGAPLASAYGARWTLANVPAEDPAVYDMLCRADTIGVFQIESRAQMSMLPRLKPRCFYDLVIEVSIVRPGPIQGGMVHPFLRRRQGLEPVVYPHPALKPILERTLGVPIFQEQVMAMAVAVAGFTPGQADALRRAMGAWRRRGTMGPIVKKLRAGLLQNGLTEDYADQVVQQIKGFGEYGFPESHASSFALLVYVSAWLKCHCPAAFTGAILNSLPMGFYAPRTLVDDARRHGVQVRPVDVHLSNYDSDLEMPDPPGPQPALRLGLRLVKGIGEEDARRVATARSEAPFRSLADLYARSGVDRGVLRKLARADAFSAGFPPGPRGSLSRRQALWEVEGLWAGPLFAAVARDEAPAPLPAASAFDDVLVDYQAVGLSLEHNPVGLVRPTLQARGFVCIAELAEQDPGSSVRIAGLVANRQRPGNAGGVMFMTLEDETGMANLVVWPRLFERQRRVIVGERLIEVFGVLQREGASVSVIAKGFRRLDIAPDVQAPSRDFR